MQPVAYSMTIDEQAEFITQVQQSLRTAQNKLDRKALEAGAGMIDSAAFMALPEKVQEDILAQYAGAMVRVTGAFTP